MGGRKWTDEELVLLEELTEKYPLETVARRLNRTKEAVFLKRQRIGIGGYMANTDMLTRNTVSKILGIENRTLQYWERKGLKSYRKRPYVMYRQEDIIKYMREHPEDWNAARVTDDTMFMRYDWYKEMDIPGIMELHRYVTNELMNEKHNVFMWTIDKYLPQTEEIMSLLGYKLHARLIWDKGNGPAPAYTVRFAHEYLLWFYKKGNIILPDKDKRGAFSTVLRENSKRHHSQKPECAYQMLETFFPQAKKLELFARAERDGWDQWGNEL